MSTVDEIDDIITLMAQTANQVKCEHYIGDLIHDGAYVMQVAEVGVQFHWVFKGNHCGTWMFYDEENYKQYAHIGGIRAAFKITVTEKTEVGRFKGFITTIINTEEQEKQSNG